MKGKHAKGKHSKESVSRSTRNIKKNIDADLNIRINRKNISKRTRETNKKYTHKKSKKRAAIITLVVILLIIATLTGGGYLYIHNKLGKLNHIEINEEDIEINEGIGQSLDNYRNIALLGVDATVDDYGVGNRTDCIIIASINKRTSEVKLFSVYRDTYVDISDNGLDKINHAYAKGGPELSMSTLNTNLDLNIKEFVVVNFDSVADSIDALGGIEIDIAKDELPLINGHVKDTAKRMGVTAPKDITKTGKQLLTGVQAVGYSRIRYTEGLDYRRTERMRTVMLAMLEKAKSKGMFELNNILTKILPEISTNVSANEIIAMLPQLANFKVTQNIGWPYETKPFDEKGPWYGVPVTLESNVAKLHKEIFGQDNYIPSQKVKEISGKIIQRTGYKI